MRSYGAVVERSNRVDPTKGTPYMSNIFIDTPRGCSTARYTDTKLVLEKGELPPSVLARKHQLGSRQIVRGKSGPGRMVREMPWKEGVA